MKTFRVIQKEDDDKRQMCWMSKSLANKNNVDYLSAFLFDIIFKVILLVKKKKTQKILSSLSATQRRIYRAGYDII